MSKIVEFDKNKIKYDELTPTLPTKAEADMLNILADDYRKEHGTPLPYALYDGRELKKIWDERILLLARAENIDPFDLLAVFFAKSHGLRFRYKEGNLVCAEIPEDADEHK